MRLNIVFGGKAGQGPNVLSHVLGNALVKMGYYVFCSRDYESLIRGGHNFNHLTFSESPVNSNDKKIDILVALDENTEKVHRKNLKRSAIILKDNAENMYYAGKIFKILGLKFEFLENELKELSRFEENMTHVKKGYEESKKSISLPELEPREAFFINGNQGVSEGAISAGLDIYYGYPMTPATAILGELAEKQKEKNILVLELENEIAVINAGIGSAITGAKVMVGTSGGGFDLMSEGLSLTGVAEVPLVIYLAQRPGPGTGVPTYNAQGDLNLARHAGHGEFSRVVLAPGDPKESYELTSQAFYFSQKFKVPVIVLSDKHLAESVYTINTRAVTIHSGKWTSFGRYNSYEKDRFGCTTEEPEIINKNVMKRIGKQQSILRDAQKFDSYNSYGNEKANNLILSWGSTKGAILDSIEGLDVRFIQMLHLEPFLNIRREIEGKNIILVENNATGQLGDLIAEKTGIIIPEKNKILRYDGRPFFADELKEEIVRRLVK